MKDKCMIEPKCPWGCKPASGMYSKELRIYATDCILYKECPRKGWSNFDWSKHAKVSTVNVVPRAGEEMLCILPTNLCIRVNTGHELYRSILRYSDIAVSWDSTLKLRYTTYTPEELGLTGYGRFSETITTLLKRDKG